MYLPSEYLHVWCTSYVLWCIYYSKASSVDDKAFEPDPNFLDITKPLFMQMWNNNFTKDYYLEQVWDLICWMNAGERGERPIVVMGFTETREELFFVAISDFKHAYRMIVNDYS